MLKKSSTYLKSIENLLGKQCPELSLFSEIELLKIRDIYLNYISYNNYSDWLIECFKDFKTKEDFWQKIDFLRTSFLKQEQNNGVDNQYIKLLKDILFYGDKKYNERTKVFTKSLESIKLSFDLQDCIPLLSVKKMFPKNGFNELMFFLRGQTNTKILEEHKINYWKGNTSREFLDKRNLNFLLEGEMGCGYGHQFRNFGGEHPLISETKNLKGVDQLDILMKELKEDPNSRRLIINLWNPKQLHLSALPPCHLYYQVTCNKEKKELSGFLLMRSWDVFLGLPQNIYQYSLITYFLAHYMGYTAKNLNCVGVDTHLYSNQFEAVETLLLKEKTEYSKPILKINKKIDNLDDLISLNYSDIKIKNYNPDNFIPVPMVV